jgi:hypothetical protein
MTATWTETLLEPVTALGRQMLTILPDLLATAILFLAGLTLAWAAGQALERFLRAIGVDRACDRLGLSASLLRGGIKSDPSHIIGRTVYWLILAFASMASLEALHLESVRQLTHVTVAYIPHLIIAAVIGIAGYLISNFVAQAVLIAAVNAGLPPARLIATGARWVVQLLSIAMALEQLGIAEHIVAVGFGITWGGVVLATALAFGLGGKDLARSFLERRLSASPRGHTGDDIHHL